MTVLGLPHYDHPPVVETILGVQFDPIPELCNAHLGAFWASLGADWPKPEDAPYLEPQFEKFDDNSPWRELALSLRLSDSKARIRIRNTSQDRMIQIQNGRFIVNWLGTQGTSYPRYDTIRDEFIDHLNAWKVFLQSIVREKLPAANQWEVTYLHQIPKGTVWDTTDEWNFCQLWGHPPWPRSMLPLESAVAEWHFVIPEQIGRLHVNWRHVLQDNKQELVLLNLTARGPCESAELANETIIEGLDHGHVAIVTAFRDMMESTANAYWGLNHAD